MRKKDLAVAVAVLLGVSGLFATARAEGDFYPPVTHDLTQAECSACHMAYPAGLLTAPSWQAIMADLGNHFGEDASLPPEAVAEITAYLTANAGKPRRGDDPANPVLRISDSRWFQREHGPRVIAKAKETPTIGSIANCAGCHRGAEKGYFEDD